MKERVVQGYERSDVREGHTEKGVSTIGEVMKERKERGRARESNKGIIGRRIG